MRFASGLHLSCMIRGFHGLRSGGMGVRLKDTMDFDQKMKRREQGADGDGEGLVVCMVTGFQWVGIDRAAPSL